MASTADRHYMQLALNLARQGLGRVAPNPSVGCVLVKRNHILSAARTGDGGRPHAEIRALEKAGTEAKGATAYVTLEPCSPLRENLCCAEALIRAGIKRVVIACEDSNPRISGRGVQMLKEHALAVETGLLEGQAKKLNAGFFLCVTENRPLITLKIATTKDGKFSKADPKNPWITGDIARRHAHAERSQHDAILVGIETVLHDNPLLTTRLDDIDHKITRIILDTNLRIPLHSNLVETADKTPLWVFYEKDSEARSKSLIKTHTMLFHENPKNLQKILSQIASNGMTRLLVEGGGDVIKSFLSANLCNRFLWYKSPYSSAKNHGKTLDQSILTRLNALKPAETRILGEDLLEVYELSA